MAELPDLFKCSTCYKTFTTPKNDGVGNQGCPSCGSHKYGFNSGIKAEDVAFLNGGQFTFIGQQIGQLVDKKNTQYGSAFLKGVDFFKLLYPNGIPPDKYIHALLTIRVFDKLIRIATCSDEAEIESPWEDIAGYGILGHSVWSRKE